jgi:hypothetical protein
MMTMSSRERLATVLNHRAADRACVDFGGTAVSGIAASTLTKLRQAVLGEKDYRVKIVEPYQMLGEIDEPLREALGIDVIGLGGRKTMFGFENTRWKPFTMFDGTEVLVPGDFNVTQGENGDLYIYPEGDTSVPPSGRMPKGGFYFDAICRQEPIVEDKLDPADNLEEFGPLSDADMNHFPAQAKKLAATGQGVMLNLGGTAFGDIALVPATWRKQTRGIRDVEEWYISTAARRDYVFKVFEKQCEIALKNFERVIPVLRDTVQAIFITGTDFGTQRGPFISLTTYRDLYKPFHKIVNDYVHQHTPWKTFIHSCGSVYSLLPDFIEAGFDILNPVQCSAADMEARRLKEQFGRDITFWGGGVCTQKTLPFGTPDEVYRQVSERIQIFNREGGFVFGAIHNVQANTPVENLLAMFRAIKDMS